MSCVCVCVCLCLCVCVFVFVCYLSTLLCGRVLFGRCCALCCADGACRASSFPYGTRVHCPVHVRRVFVFALPVYLQFRRRTVGECRSYCRCFVGEDAVSVRVQLSCVMIRFCSVVSDSRRHCKSAPSVCLRVAVRVLFLRRGCVVPLANRAALRRSYVQPRTGVTCARYSSRCGT